MSRIVFDAPNLPALSDIAKALAPRLYGKVVFLSGGVGAGKTTFVGSLVPFLGYVGDASSPTFTIVNEYQPTQPPSFTLQGHTNNNGDFMPIYHMDLYRLDGMQQLENIGFWDLVDNRATILVEWAEVVSLNTFLPADCSIHFSRLQGNQPPLQGRLGGSNDGMGSCLGCTLEVVFHNESSL